ncbi:hypothetical protein DPMN_035692 [Dreissena polymorpha]|uniref:Zinc finger PHD-type domain-containing protein n=1 Tax=Dreissena polymorpha TaxID=45954 RepID=A0A9D4RKT1_DREPO|nr:hypothetical protein DPMN_035692 [Dreissena polymorpha]
MDEGDGDCVCVVCGHIVSDECKAIMCDECDRWQHRHCQTGVTLSQYNRMVKGIIELSFVCVPCRERPSVEVMEVYVRDDSISESESDHESVPEPGQETESDMDTSVHVTVVRVSDVPMNTSVRVIEVPVSAVPMETNDDRSFRAEAPFEEPGDDLEQLVFL